jgi:hypothetical protein
MKNEKRGFVFADDLAPLILNGRKTFTYRLGNKYDGIRPGDRCFATYASTRKPFAEIEILDKNAVPFSGLPTDSEGHETYPSKEALRQTFESYYKRPVTDDEAVLVFQFKVLKRL